VIARFGVLLLAAAAAFCEPRLLVDPAGFDRAEVLRRVAEWPAAHGREFGLREWALPTASAGWSHAYVCPVHGVRLHQKAGRNLCGVDGKDYHGWPSTTPYMQRNDDNGRAARDLGVAFQLTGEAGYAEKGPADLQRLRRALSGRGV
jgi:hypothetical protein